MTFTLVWLLGIYGTLLYASKEDNGQALILHATAQERYGCLFLAAFWPVTLLLIVLMLLFKEARDCFYPKEEDATNED